MKLKRKAKYVQLIILLLLNRHGLSHMGGSSPPLLNRHWLSPMGENCSTIIK
jgi:hypothetical protein